MFPPIVKRVRNQNFQITQKINFIPFEKLLI